MKENILFCKGGYELENGFQWKMYTIHRHSECFWGWDLEKSKLTVFVELRKWTTEQNVVQDDISSFGKEVP
jgi:hypothetical protein